MNDALDAARRVLEINETRLPSDGSVEVILRTDGSPAQMLLAAIVMENYEAAPQLARAVLEGQADKDILEMANKNFIEKGNALLRLVDEKDKEIERLKAELSKYKGPFVKSEDAKPGDVLGWCKVVYQGRGEPLPFPFDGEDE